MTRPDDWEAVGRETLHQVLVSLASEIEASVEPVADTVYWGGDPDAEQVERLRQLAFEFEYAVEAYVAALADDAEPWGDDDGRAPSWEPGGDAAAAADTSSDRDDADASDDTDADDTDAEREDDAQTEGHDRDNATDDSAGGASDSPTDDPVTDDPPTDEE